MSDNIQGCLAITSFVSSFKNLLFVDMDTFNYERDLNVLRRFMRVNELSGVLVEQITYNTELKCGKIRYYELVFKKTYHLVCFNILNNSAIKDYLIKLVKYGWCDPDYVIAFQIKHKNVIRVSKKCSQHDKSIFKYLFVNVSNTVLHKNIISLYSAKLQHDLLIYFKPQEYEFEDYDLTYELYIP